MRPWMHVFVSAYTMGGLGELLRQQCSTPCIPPYNAPPNGRQERPAVGNVNVVWKVSMGQYPAGGLYGQVRKEPSLQGLTAGAHGRGSRQGLTATHTHSRARVHVCALGDYSSRRTLRDENGGLEGYHACRPSQYYLCSLGQLLCKSSPVKRQLIRETTRVSMRGAIRDNW